jgi:hypothetical protein
MDDFGGLGMDGFWSFHSILMDIWQGNNEASCPKKKEMTVNRIYYWSIKEHRGRFG